MKALTRALDLTAAGFVAVAVVATALGGVVTFPLNRAGLLWPYYWAMTGFAVAALVSMPPRRWGSWGAWAFVAPIGVLLAWLPYASGVAPDARAADIEVRRLLLALLIAAFVLAPVRGSRAGAVGLRVGWTGALAASVGIGLWEIVTKEHVPLDPRGWVFGDARLAVGTFINPNNFATALVGMIAGALALRAGLRARWARWALDALALLGAVVVVFTQSRAGLGALLVVLALEAWRRRPTPLPPTVMPSSEGPSRSSACRRELGRSPSSPHEEPESSPASPGHLDRRRALGLGAAVLALLVLASVTIPALASRNPLVQLWRITFTDETARSDDLRLGLIRAALRYLRESGWLGAGAGSFEPLLWADPDPGVVKLTNLHNAFVEILSQYGVVVAGVHAVAMLGLLGVVLRRSRPSRHRRDDLPGAVGRDTRAEIAGYLMAYVAFGVTASSSLTNPTWWLLYASACAAWWTAHAPDSPPPTPAPADAPSVSPKVTRSVHRRSTDYAPGPKV